MPETPELIAGAATKLQDAVAPLAYPQPHWDGHKILQSDPLYLRMRIALTAATIVTGARLQASKAPARIDVMAWFCDIDATVAQWPGPAGTTLTKLQHYHEHHWTPDELRFCKAVTRRAEAWTDTARDLLGDNPPIVPLRKPCPRCEAFWSYSGPDQIRTYALRVGESGAQCLACKARWTTKQELGVFIKMLA